MAWKSIFLSHVNSVVPSKVVASSKPKLPWMSAKLRELIKGKHAAWRLFKRNPATETPEAFRKVRNNVTSALRQAERCYLQALHRDIRLTQLPQLSYSGAMLSG